MDLFCSCFLGTPYHKRSFLGLGTCKRSGGMPQERMAFPSSLIFSAFNHSSLTFAKASNSFFLGNSMTLNMLPLVMSRPPVREKTAPWVLVCAKAMTCSCEFLSVMGILMTFLGKNEKWTHHSHALRAGSMLSHWKHLLKESID